MRLYSFFPFIWIQTVPLFKVKHTISVNSHLIRSLVRFCLLFGALIQIDIFEARPMRECLCQYHSMPCRKQICDMEALKLKLMPTLFGKLRSELIGVIIIPMPCHRLLVFSLSLSISNSICSFSYVLRIEGVQTRLMGWLFDVTAPVNMNCNSSKSCLIIANMCNMLHTTLITSDWHWAIHFEWPKSLAIYAALMTKVKP